LLPLLSLWLTEAMSAAMASIWSSRQAVTGSPLINLLAIASQRRPTTGGAGRDPKEAIDEPHERTNG
jgi:hypothetical protein